MEHIEMEPIFGILVALTKNEVTKICNEPGIRYVNGILLFQGHIQVNNFCL